MAKDLTSKEIAELVTEHFGSVLREFGFTDSGSKKVVFWRKTDYDIYHYVTAWRSRRLPKYDIMVFAFHPSFDEDFESNHPDKIGCPIRGYLHSKYGVGARSEQLFCKTKDGFVKDFEKRGRMMLIDHAITFLDQIQNLQDLKPLLIAPGLR